MERGILNSISFQTTTFKPATKLPATTRVAPQSKANPFADDDEHSDMEEGAVGKFAVPPSGTQEDVFGPHSRHNSGAGISVASTKSSTFRVFVLLYL